MYRTLLAAALLMPAAAQAQYAPPPSPPPPQDRTQDRPMPSYEEHETMQVNAPEERYGTADTRHAVDQTPPPPPVPPGYGYPDYGYPQQAPQQGSHPQPYGDPARENGWRTPKPYSRADQVDQGRADDAAHRADRAYTARLNQRRWSGYNAPSYDAPADAPPPAPTRPRKANDAYAQASADYRAQLAEHQRAMQAYQADQAGYADRMARWRARTDACERGNLDACDGR